MRSAEDYSFVIRTQAEIDCESPTRAALGTLTAGVTTLAGATPMTCRPSFGGATVLRAEIALPRGPVEFHPDYAPLLVTVSRQDDYGVREQILRMALPPFVGATVVLPGVLIFLFAAVRRLSRGE